MGDIEAQKHSKYGKVTLNNANESWPLPARKKKRVSNHPSSSSLASNSCPSFSFSTFDKEEPLGRWVRYPPPRELPSLGQQGGALEEDMFRMVRLGRIDSGSSSAEDCVGMQYWYNVLTSTQCCLNIKLLRRYQSLTVGCNQTFSLQEVSKDI